MSATPTYHDDVRETSLDALRRKWEEEAAWAAHEAEREMTEAERRAALDRLHEERDDDQVTPWRRV